MTSQVHAEQSQPLPMSSPFWVRLMPYVGMFLLALLMWLPFGFKTTGLIEEIGINHVVEQGYQLFFVGSDSPMSFVRTRPLQMFTFALAFTLDRDSYTYYNVITMLFLFGNMVAAYWLMLQFLPGKKLLAFVVGVLYMLYPSDTGIFALRTIHIHCATLAYLLAVYLLIQFSKRRDRSGWLALFGAMLLFIISLLQYQIALVAGVLTPILLLYFTRPNRRFWIGTGLWYASMIAVLVFALWANGQAAVKSYEGGLLPTHFTLNDFLLMIQAAGMAYWRQVTAWAAAINKLSAFPIYGIYIVVGIVVSAAVGGYLMWRERTEKNDQPVSRQRYELVFIGALAWFGIGIATYLPIPSHRVQDFRIFFLGMLGSAVILGLGLYLISRLAGRFRNVLFIILALPFMGLAFLNAFQQQQFYVNYSLQQQSILQQTVAQAPQIKPDTAILIIDRTGIIDQEYGFFYGFYLSNLMQYIYSDLTLQSSFCLADDIPTYAGIHCKFDQNKLEMFYDPAYSEAIYGPVLHVPNSQLLIFETGAGGQLTLLSAEAAANELKITDYDPQARIIGQNPPHRASTMFSCEPALSCYKQAPNDITTTFDLPAAGQIGAGWRQPEDDGTGGTFRWSVTPKTSVNVDLSHSSDLSVDFKVLHWVEAPVIDSLKLTFYGQDIPLTFSPTDDGGRLYHATIPNTLLAGLPTHTFLVFSIERLSFVSDAQSLGFALNWLRIRPVSSEP